MTAIELITRIKEDLVSLEALVTKNTVFPEENIQEFKLDIDYPIGTVGKLKGTLCKIAPEINGCDKCISPSEGCYNYRCTGGGRKDGIGIIFKAL